MMLESLGVAGTWPKGPSETTRDARGAWRRRRTVRIAEDRRIGLRRWRLQGWKRDSQWGFRMGTAGGTYTITGQDDGAKSNKGGEASGASVVAACGWRAKTATRGKQRVEDPDPG